MSPNSTRPQRPIEALQAAIDAAAGTFGATGSMGTVWAERGDAVVNDLAANSDHKVEAALASKPPLLHWHAGVAARLSLLESAELHVKAERRLRSPQRWTRRIARRLSAPFRRDADGDPIRAWEEALLDLAAAAARIEPGRPIFAVTHHFNRLYGVEAVEIALAYSLIQFRSDVPKAEGSSLPLPPFPKSVTGWFSGIVKAEAKFRFRSGSAHETAAVLARVGARPEERPARP